ncbi:MULTISPECIES: PP2C family serine/threonine-protein phosphatase [unclassified Moraxella]|uniref:PP2C family serine/threonine-protein phosphatase n=1 Tax=unclassified Moraxella TaxID=2685852 RepID=UPI003AF685EB
MTNDNLSPTTTPIWQVFGASSIGKSHLDTGLPNQDHVFFQQYPEFSVAVVCDGAGSAKFSQQGSEFFSHHVSRLLAKLAREYGSEVAQTIYKNNLLLGFNEIRQKLVHELPSDRHLRDYHTTLTGVVIWHTGSKAVLVQVGDSPLLTSEFAVTAQTVDYFKQIQLFGDDSKNEYVNETHFITQDNWQDFLRIQWLDVSKVDCIALMSDGCADLVLEGASQTPQVYRPFFGNLLFNVCQSPTLEQGNALIEQALANPATYRLTGDDKSLIILLKNPNQYQGLEPLIEPSISVETVKTNIAPSTQVAQNAQSNSVWTNNSAVSNHQPSATGFNQIANPNQNQSAQLPTDSLPKPLPQAVPISETGKQRRNTALLASIAVLAGAGTLVGLNFDKIQQLINSKQIAVSAPPKKTAPNLPPLTFSPTNQAFSLNTDLQIGNVSPHFFIQMVMAIPKNMPANHLPLFDGHKNAVDTTLINPNRLPFNQSSNDEKNDILEQRLSLDYQFKCEPILPKNQSMYQPFGINFLPDKDYQYCRIDLKAPQNPSFNFVLDSKFSHVLISGGVGQMLGHETTPSIDKQKQQLGDKYSHIMLYYLPSSFSAKKTNN